MNTHRAFDRLWDPGRGGPFAARNDAYVWLARQLRIEQDACHVGLFDVALCNRAIQLCNALWAEGRP
jgi:hypothetical protein